MSLFLIAVFFLVLGPTISPVEPDDSFLDDTISRYETGSAFRRLSLILAFAVAFIALLRKRLRRWIPRWPVMAPWLGYLLVVAFSISWSEWPSFTFRRTVVFFFVVVVALFIADRFGTRGLMDLASRYCIVVIAAALAVTAFHGAPVFSDSEWRLGGIIHPVNLSWHCGALLLCTIGRIHTHSHLSRRLIVLAVCSMLLLAATKTRTSIVATIAGVVVFYLYKKVRRTGLLFASAGCAAALIVLLAVQFPGTPLRLIESTANLLSFGRVDAAEQFTTLTGRTDVWEALIPALQEHLWLGHGFNSFFNPGNFDYIAEQAGWVATSPHSGYLEIALGVGAVGLLLLVTTWVAIAVVPTPEMAKPERAFTVSVFAWLAVNSAFEAALVVDPIFLTVMWISLVFGAGLTRVPREGATPTPESR